MSPLSWLSVRMLTQRGGGTADFLRWRHMLESAPSAEVEAEADADAEAYRQVYDLVALESQRNPREFFDRTFMAIFLLKCLRTCGFLSRESI